jgi:hypothetical protein
MVSGIVSVSIKFALACADAVLFDNFSWEGGGLQDGFKAEFMMLLLCCIFILFLHFMLNVLQTHDLLDM